MAARVVLSGVKELANALAAHGEAIDKAISQALYATGIEIRNKSGQLVPIDTGNLRSTRNVEFEDAGKGREKQVTISYGDTATPYAIVQHERLDYNHKAGRQAKYLEQPFLEATAFWPQPLIEKVRAIYWTSGNGPA